MTGRPLRVLCLDIEGGYGGSSRSLSRSLRWMDQSRVAAEVWCRREGPIQDFYRRHGISVGVTPAMPVVGALPRLSRNLYVQARFLAEWRRAEGFRAELLAALGRFDLVHFNHETLHRLASWLRRARPFPATMHIRTTPVVNAFSRRQSRGIVGAVDRLVFIGDSVRRRFADMAGGPVAGDTICNIVDALDPAVPAHPAIPRDGRFVVAALSNFAWLRGTDRIVDVAAALAASGRRDIVFVVAGAMALHGRMPGVLGAMARRGRSLADYAAHRGVGDMFVFPGHVERPETVLAGADLLVKFARERATWSRDILEALGYGRPVIAVGDDARFVETGVTGYLFDEFDAGAIAARIAALADDPALARRLGAAGAARVAALADGRARAADLAAVWRDVVADRARAP
jgi:glycosyltransferase involved in cell wall biosynthesis